MISNASIRDFTSVTSFRYNFANTTELARITLPARTLSVCRADAEDWRWGASALINKMYGWRGYGSGFTVGGLPNQLTLVAVDSSDDTVVGTLTVGLDSEKGLLADRLYLDDVQQLRDQGYRPCEFVKFAVDNNIKSKYLLAALFHIAFIHAYYVNKHNMLLIEVNPQHVAFYRRMLHFEVRGQERLNPRVNAPSILLGLDLTYGAGQVQSFGGLGENSSERSLFPYFFSEFEHELICNRMRKGERPASTGAEYDEELALAAVPA